MIQNIIGIVVGALITFVLLVLFDGNDIFNFDRNTGYIVAIIVGGIANFLWPIVIGIWMGRRVKARRDNAIEEEVQRQLSEQQGRKP